MDWIDSAEQNFSYDNFRARLKTAIRSEGLSWFKFCEKAGVPHAQALRAIEACQHGIRANLVVIDKLASTLGRNSRWLVSGEDTTSKFSESIGERSHRLIEEYAYRAQIPDEDVPRLHGYVETMVQGLQAHTDSAAYRRGLPSSWMDVAWIYDEFRVMQG